MVVMALTALASFFALSNRIPSGTALPESSLHLATLLAAKNRPVAAQPAQADRSAETQAAVIRRAEPAEARPHLPIVRARESRTSGAAEPTASSLQETGGALVVRSLHASLQLRGEPDDEAVAIGSYSAGTPLAVVETAADWHRVVGPDGRWGWVRAAGLTEAAAASAKSKVRRIEVSPDRLPASGERR
ncbi:MAG TPA: SH3 domain-containing protein [Afifellaceae bacterium]|nr:SH3 domain-containing protein [Afifellaceae bacterium]